MSLALVSQHVIPARRLLHEVPVAEESWSLETLFGRFIELSGGPATAGLTIAAQLIAQAQRRHELAAWVGNRNYTFYPPDFAACGIDLAALPVVHAPDVKHIGRATDALIRSGGFALVIMDLGNADFPMPVQTRLVGLAQKHHTALIALTRRDADAVQPGSLVSIRAQTEKQRTDFDRFSCTLHILKDKRQSPGRIHVEICDGTDGLT